MHIAEVSDWQPPSRAHTPLPARTRSHARTVSPRRHDASGRTVRRNHCLKGESPSFSHEVPGIELRAEIFE